MSLVVNRQLRLSCQTTNELESSLATEMEVPEEQECSFH